MIGSALVRHLLELYPNSEIVLPVRNKAKAEAMLGSAHGITIHECDLLSTNFEFAGDVDYIVHCAAPTSNKFFVQNPVETYSSVFEPSLHLLEYATHHPVKGFVYLSSLEVYGTIPDGMKSISEHNLGYIDLTSPRSCYPLAKRAAEHLCSLYAHQFKVPVSIARLTQTTGPGVPFDDGRVINAFCRSAFLGEDIILHTSGKSSRPYCHVDDAVAAILLLLKKGKRGEAYNVANEATYISAYNLALSVKQLLNQSIDVKVELKDNVPFAPPSFLPLSTSKLQALGWTPNRSLEDICNDVFNYYKNLHQHES